MEIHRGWRQDPKLLGRVRGLFDYQPGEDRATGHLYSQGDGLSWPLGFAATGRELLADLAGLTGVTYTIAAFQAYRNGAGCTWHADTPFGAQAILSLGAARAFGTRRTGGQPSWITVSDGDLVVMPPGFQQEWEHCVPVEPGRRGERCSLVFRIPA